MIGLLAGWLIGRLAGWLDDWMVGWLVGCSVGLPVYRLDVRLSGRSVSHNYLKGPEVKLPTLLSEHICIHISFFQKHQNSISLSQK